MSHPNKQNLWVPTSESPLNLQSPGTSLHSLSKQHQCLPLPRNVSVCRFQFILTCPRRIFLNIGEVINHVTHYQWCPRSWTHSITQRPSWSQPLTTFLTVLPSILLSISTTKSYIPNHIRNPWDSPNSLCPLVPLYLCTRISLEMKNTFSALPSPDFTGSLPPQTKLTSPILP